MEGRVERYVEVGSHLMEKFMLLKKLEKKIKSSLRSQASGGLRADSPLKPKKGSFNGSVGFVHKNTFECA